MDWYVVEFLYPASFSRFIKTMFPNVGILSTSTLEYYDIKKLYRFFDKEGIYLTIEMYKPSQWVYSISLHNGIVIGPEQEPKQNREDVECDGFVSCFGALDKQLRCYKI